MEGKEKGVIAKINEVAGRKSSYRFSGRQIQEMRLPLVYAWIRGDEILYIGKSNNGLQRPIAKNHERTKDIETNDRLIVWHCLHDSEATGLEKILLVTFSPKLNRPISRGYSGTHRKSNLPCLYRRLDRNSWVLDFTFHGKRFLMTIGHDIPEEEAIRLAKLKRSQIETRVISDARRIPIQVPNRWPTRDKTPPVLGNILNNDPIEQ